MLSCQRTEYRAVDCGSGYGGAVKKNVKRWEKEKVVELELGKFFVRMKSYYITYKFYP